MKSPINCKNTQQELKAMALGEKTDYWYSYYFCMRETIKIKVSDG